MINKNDQNFDLWLHTISDDYNWTKYCDTHWELLTCIILDTRTPLERLKKVVGRLKKEDNLDYRTLRTFYEKIGHSGLAAYLKDVGYPWYNQKARYFNQWILIDLETATWEEMQMIKGIGPKLASLWMRIAHNDETHPVIDAHVWRWALAHGYVGPALGSSNGYSKVSAFMIKQANELGIGITELDQSIVAEGIMHRRGLKV